MFFSILLVSMLFALVAFPVGFYLDSRKLDDFLLGLVPAFIANLFLGIPVIGVWQVYANDYAAVVGQEQIIQVQEDRVNSLSERLEEFNYPRKAMLSFDSDSPWASIVQSLSEAEDNLASAKDERARAIREIESWKRGPMSGVVTFVGDPIQ